jgi:hypothetical protein
VAKNGMLFGYPVIDGAMFGIEWLTKIFCAYFIRVFDVFRGLVSTDYVRNKICRSVSYNVPVNKVLLKKNIFGLRVVHENRVGIRTNLAIFQQIDYPCFVSSKGGLQNSKRGI